MNTDAAPSKSELTARAEIVRRCREFVLRYHEADARIASAQEAIKKSEEEKADVLRRIHDCMAAARVLNFDIAEAMQNAGGFDNSVIVSTSADTTKQSVRELVLEAVRSASPNPVKASDVRKRVEQLRSEKLHDKTVGMTLYRLSREGLVRRDGWNWFLSDQPTVSGKSNEEIEEATNK